MTATTVVTRLALRELWISFRLLILLAGYVGVGALVALLPASAPDTLWRLSIGLAAAIILGAVIAAGALSTERVLGRAGWLVTRSISRSTLLVGWFLALGGGSLLGLAAAGLLGWLAVSSPRPPVAPVVFASVIAASAAMSLAGIAIGLLLGSLLRPLPAMVGALALGIAAVAAIQLFAPGFALPVATLRELLDVERPVAAGISGGGACLVATAAAMILGRVALGRVDL